MTDEERETALRECTALMAVFESLQLLSEQSLERIALIEAGLRADKIDRDYARAMEGLRIEPKVPVNVS